MSEPPRQDDQPDFYTENGCVVFTAAYHRRRGYCCGSGCRHCPYEGDEKRSASLRVEAEPGRVRR